VAESCEHNNKASKLSLCLTKYYAMNVFLTTSLVGDEWSASRLGRFNHGERSLYPKDRRLGGPQSRSGRYGEVKILDPTGIRTPTPPSTKAPVFHKSGVII
jgi:hypothetical protein